VLPIGLDSSTPYQFDEAVTFNQGQVGPGNWGSPALGGTGGTNERTNIADGYQGLRAINQWIDPEPGFKKGPVGQGFSDRIAQAHSEFPNGTFGCLEQPQRQKPGRDHGFCRGLDRFGEWRDDPGSFRQHRRSERSRRWRPQKTGPG
jgi:hypothetical protein